MRPEENELGWRFSLLVLANSDKLIESLKKFDINYISEY